MVPLSRSNRSNSIPAHWLRGISTTVPNWAAPAPGSLASAIRSSANAAGFIELIRRRSHHSLPRSVACRHAASMNRLIVRRTTRDGEFPILVVHDDDATFTDIELLGHPWLNDHAQAVIFNVAD